MRVLAMLFTVAGLTMAAMTPTFAEAPMLETFQNHPETRWRFFADTVMGGVSTGKVDFVEEGAVGYARLTGTVSTRNNGGFIQIRMALPTTPPSDATGVRAVVRGNGQDYFVHLRTSGTMLPWQYYQAGFAAPRDWTEIRLPFTAFKPSGSLLRAVPTGAKPEVDCNRRLRARLRRRN